MTGNAHDHAPDHVVAVLAASWPRPNYMPGTGPSGEEWRRFLQMHADRIWQEAFVAGIEHYVRTVSRPMLVVTAEERAQMIERFPVRTDLS